MASTTPTNPASDRKTYRDGDTLRVVEWDRHFENNRSRDVKKLSYVCVPNKQDGDGYTELLDHPNGAAHYGCWMAILQVASKCGPRGTLVRDTGVAHTCGSIGRMSRLPAALLAEAIERLIQIGWLESIPSSGTDLETERQHPAPSCGNVPSPPQVGAAHTEGEGERRRLEEREQKEITPPPPPVEEHPAPPVPTKPSLTQGQVEKAAAAAGIVDLKCVGASIARGNPLAKILAIIEHYQAHPGRWDVNALHWRLTNPGNHLHSAEEGWPLANADWSNRQRREEAAAKASGQDSGVADLNRQFGRQLDALDAGALARLIDHPILTPRDKAMLKSDGAIVRTRPDSRKILLQLLALDAKGTV